MSGFWVLSVVLAVLAIAFIAFPVFKVRKLASQSLHVIEERQKQNIQIFRERIAELESDLAENKIDQTQFSELKEELELALLEDVDASEKDSSKNNSNSALGVAFVCSVLVIVASYGLYLETGAYDKVEQRLAMQFDRQELDAAQEAARSGDMSALLEQLYSKLQDTPDNIEGWLLLSRTAMNMERFDMAITGYEQVIRILESTTENPAPVYGLLAQAHYFNEAGVGGSGDMSTKVEGLLSKALELDPQESNALGLYAIHAFDTKDYESAIEYWQKVLVAVPNHPAKESIESGIARAKSLAGTNPDVAMTESADTDSGAQVEVTVALDESLASFADPNDFVFIFARAESGPPMPLAASRHKVSELPVTVVLNDAKAMAPMAKLSQVENANIVARVSKSGQPIAQAGDLEGQSLGVSVWDKKKVSITIDTRL